MPPPSHTAMIAKINCNKDDESTIIRHILAGDVDLFETLIERYRQKVFGMIAKRIPGNDIEDVAQDVFVDAYHSLGSYRCKKPFEHWLSRIALRRCCDYWRKRGKENNRAEHAINKEHIDWLETISSDISQREFEKHSRQRESSEILRWALDQLNAEDRMAVDFVYFEGLHTKEAAKIIGWSVPKTKVKVFRARRKLKTLITGLMENQNNEK